MNVCGDGLLVLGDFSRVLLLGIELLLGMQQMF